MLTLPSPTTTTSSTLDAEARLASSTSCIAGEADGVAGGTTPLPPTRNLGAYWGGGFQTKYIHALHPQKNSQRKKG